MVQGLSGTNRGQLRGLQIPKNIQDLYRYSPDYQPPLTLLISITMRVTFHSIFSTALLAFAGIAYSFPSLPVSCPQILPAPPPASLSGYFLPQQIESSQLADIETIRQTLHFYSLVLDSKAFPLLDKVFAPTATANYSGLAGIFEGLPAIQNFLAGSLAPYPKTQHLIANHIIDVCASTSAVSQTYFMATHFPNSTTTGSAFTAYVTHQDVWEKTADGWRIVYSNFGVTVNLPPRTSLKCRAKATLTLPQGRR